MALAVVQISNLYSVDSEGNRHYVEDELMMSETRVLFCDVWYAGANPAYANLSLYDDNLSIVKTVKMFPFEDFSGGRTFGVSTEKLWAPSIGTDIEEETITEATELEGTLIYDITMPGDVNEKIGPIRINGDYEYYKFTPPPVHLTLLYKPVTSNTYYTANGEVDIYALIEIITDDNVSVEEIN